MKQLAENNFEAFLAHLKSGNDEAWLWLVSHLQKRVLPWIRKKDGKLPAHAIIAESYFVEEVFAEGLIKFYELFETGTFESLADLRGLMFRISDLKLKEGYRSFKKDQIIFFPEYHEDKLKYFEKEDMAEEIKEKQQLIKAVEQQLTALSKEDQEILLRHANGEKIRTIAADLGIKEAYGRKKKQRALEKLRSKLYQAFNI